MIKIAITGTIASGKTYVLNCLKELGFSVLSSDVVVDKLLKENLIVIKYLKENFPEVYENNILNKKKLALRVFENDLILKKYEDVIYQELNKLRDKFIIKNKNKKLLFFEIPLLFEKNLEENYDKIILIDANRPDLKKRLKEREKILGKELLKKIISKQIPNQVKYNKVDYIINTSVNNNELKEQINRIIKNL